MAMVWPKVEKGKHWFSDESSKWSSGSLAIKATYFILHQVDVFLTLIAVSMGYTELNPLMRAMLDSPIQLVVIKVFIPLVIIWLCPNKLLIPAAAFLLLVVLWNVKELLLVII